MRNIQKENMCSCHPHVRKHQHPALKVFIVCYAAALSADSMARMVMRTMPPKFRISVPCRM